MLELTTVVALAGKRDAMLENEERMARRWDDREVLSFPAEVVDVGCDKERHWREKTLKETLRKWKLGQLGRARVFRAQTDANFPEMPVLS
jgi:hypothetical protein